MTPPIYRRRPATTMTTASPTPSRRQSDCAASGACASRRCGAGFYDILDKLGGEGKAAAPPTVYRALEFLIEAGLVHRLDSLNAFIGCPDPARSHAGQFLICRRCRTVLELDDPDIDAVVAKKAETLGFTAVHQMLEVQGLCGNCGGED